MIVVEVNSAAPVALKALFYSPLISSYSKFTGNVIEASSLQIWIQVRRFFGLQAFIFRAPLAANYRFLPSLLDSTFSVWVGDQIYKRFIY